MNQIESSDGTLIAYEKTGEGPPMVLIHGTPDDHTYWEMVIPKISKNFTIYAIDRRGRGKSGDGLGYNLDLEFDDVTTVVDMIDQPVILLGHSHGGIVSLEAAIRSKNLSKLVLYEPPIMKGDKESEEYILGIISEIEAALNQGKKERAFLLFQEKLLGTPENEIEKERQRPYWKVVVGAAHTLPRELRAGVKYRFDHNKFNDLKTPTLLLSGSESSPLLKEATKRLADTLPNSKIALLEGQEHDAARTAPDLFAQKVINFAME